MVKIVFREIKNSLGRYMAILAIIALGTGFLSGLLVTRPAMINTLDTYLSDADFYDWRLVSTLGYDSDDVDAMKRCTDVEAAEGAVEVDFLSVGNDGSDKVMKAHSITKDVNRLTLKYGRMPQDPKECVVDWMWFSEDDIGGSVCLAADNDQDTLDMFSYTEYTIVGIVTSPLYINFERGSTSLGNGSVSGYVFIPYDGFDVDYFTEVYVALNSKAKVYSDEYKAIADASEAEITALANERAEIRYNDIVEQAYSELSKAENEYDDAYAQYEEGLSSYEEEREKADKELDDARFELTDAEKKRADGWNDYYDGKSTFEKEHTDALNELDEAEEKLDDALQKLNEGETEYATGKEKLAEGENEYADGLSQYENGLSQYIEASKQLEDSSAELARARNELDDAAASLAAGKKQLDEQQGQFDSMVTAVAAALRCGSDELMDKLRSGDPQTTAAANSVLAAMGTDSQALLYFEGQLSEAWKEYHKNLSALSDGEDEYDAGVLQLNAAEAELAEAKKKLDDSAAKLSDARAELDEGWEQLAESRVELDDGWNEYNNGVSELEEGRSKLNDEAEKAEKELSDAYNSLIKAGKDIDSGWEQYYDAKSEAEKQFSDAAAELADGKEELDKAAEEIAEAKADIAELEKPDVYVLGRGTNVGYVCFENDSNIVAGVAKVFPVFFFMVAALVCITTMTRMVEEERTQIGVMKAMGFSSGQIMWKYLFYSGSASLAGCILGFFAGSYAFPAIIWQAYCIMYGFTDILFYLDLPLGTASTAAYIAISSCTTWLACRSELKNVPAELMRPKPPKAGKRILLERITPLWKRVKFMHKVSIRNIMRYKQRMFMMMLGIGGCTALLVTGYGIRDSIKDVVSFQYDEISLYEYTIAFAHPQTGESAEKLLGGIMDDLDRFQVVYLANIDVEANGIAKSTYVVAPEEGELEGIVDLHSGDKSVVFPKAGEAVICTNLAETLGIKVGDGITLRDGDMNTLDLTVSGIFDNYVYNYVYVSPESFEQQWGHLPEMKTAFASPAPGRDIHQISAEILDCGAVNSVSSSSDMKNRVTNMMSSLDYIVWLIIICSGALAFIVLYNLTNINITERLREIATIKVLGFYPSEVSGYVFRENIVLTAMGAVIGLPLGVLLHAYVIGQIKIDMMHFQPRILPVSYLLALVFTFLFAIIVNIVMYYRLERINMAEALKSVE